MPDPDFIYNPDNWDCTYSWRDRDELTDGDDLDEPHEFATLMIGPPKWAVEVVLTPDQDGEPDETEIQWHDTREAALAARKAGV